MARLKQNFISGTITDNPLLVGATTVNSAGLASLSAIAAPDIAVLVLDPLGVAGAPEIVWVTAHTGAATSATISRAAEGTTARQHLSGVTWILAATIRDFLQAGTMAAQAALVSPKAGDQWYSSDLDATSGLYVHNGTSWRQPWNMPWGIMGLATTTTAQTGITTITDLTSLTITFTAVALRRYKTTLWVPFTEVTTGGLSDFTIATGGNTQLAKASYDVIANKSLTAVVIVYSSLSAGSQTLKGRALCSAGTISTLATATCPVSICVEDIGPVAGAPS